MYGVSFENVELERVAASITRAVTGRPEKRGALSLCEEMLEVNMALFENLKSFAGVRFDQTKREVIFTPPILLSLKALSAVIKSLSVLFYTAERRNTAYKRISGRQQFKGDTQVNDVASGSGIGNYGGNGLHSSVIWPESEAGYLDNST